MSKTIEFLDLGEIFRGAEHATHTHTHTHYTHNIFLFWKIELECFTKQ